MAVLFTENNQCENSYSHNYVFYITYSFTKKSQQSKLHFEFDTDSLNLESRVLSISSKKLIHILKEYIFSQIKPNLATFFHLRRLGILTVVMHR